MTAKQIYNLLKKTDSPPWSTMECKCIKGIHSEFDKICVNKNSEIKVKYGGWRGSCDCDEYREETRIIGSVDSTTFEAKGSDITYIVDGYIVKDDKLNMKK